MYIVHYEGKTLGKVFAESTYAAIDFMYSRYINAGVIRAKLKAFPIRKRRAGKEVTHE